ncbi:MAG: bile acid:sodium symporter family protein [Calditrichaceae bacterium]|nr:bile acid:sodium symporter family protein [Calditrichaceae bacterium]MBN2707842.1 bile acid:sodium symporter family protein [Calditrichaceae bacterium]RQV94908.1 MAG: bile acid:sodium symporter family protein [Calditrichota bacterium]
MFKKYLDLYNKLFVLWVILGGLAAYFFPDTILIFKDYMDYFFALTMFGIGMVLKGEDFVNIFKNLKQVLIGVVSQFTIMPGLAFILVYLFSFSDAFSLGLILTGSAPGAMASNVLSYLAGADVAYSVSLTTVSTLLAPVLTPAITLLLAHQLFEIPAFEMFLSVFWMVILPLLAGIAINHYSKEKVKSVGEIFPALSTTFIVFICAMVIAGNHDYLPLLGIDIFAAAVLLNLSGLTLGYLVGKTAKFEINKRRALSIEIGMQNAGLGSVLALKHFNEQAALPAVIFVFICIFSASLLVPYWSRNPVR